MDENILYVPIQINGGETIPQELQNALERELYIRFDTNGNYDGMLYVGKKINDETRYIPVMVDKALSAQSIGDINSEFFLSTASQHEGLRFAGFKVDYDGLKSLGDESPTPVIEKLNMSQLRKLTITEDMYGVNLPSTGEQGQLFFKLSESEV